MKNKLILIGLLLCLFAVTDATAQLSRKERKEWKKKKKAMEPEEFKAFTEENNSLKQQVNSMNGKVASLQSTLSDKDAKIADLQNELKEMEATVASLQAEEVDVTENNTRTAKGVVFKVQIGAFKKIDLSQYENNSETFNAEDMGNGMQRYTLGNFTDYWEADKFKKNLRRMGVKDAWIVPYKDGKRVPMKDVLEGVI